MTYSQSCEILNLTTPKSVAANAKLAESIMRTLVAGAPLRIKVACQMLIAATSRKIKILH